MPRPRYGSATAIWSTQPSPGNRRSSAAPTRSEPSTATSPRHGSQCGESTVVAAQFLVDRRLAFLPLRERVVDQVEQRPLLAGLEQAEVDAERRARGRRAGTGERVREDPRCVALGAAEATQQRDGRRVVVAHGLAGDGVPVFAGPRRPPFHERGADAATAMRRVDEAVRAVTVDLGDGHDEAVVEHEDDVGGELDAGPRPRLEDLLLDHLRLAPRLLLRGADDGRRGRDVGHRRAAHLVAGEGALERFAGRGHPSMMPAAACPIVHHAGR